MEIFILRLRYAHRYFKATLFIDAEYRRVCSSSVIKWVDVFYFLEISDWCFNNRGSSAFMINIRTIKIVQITEIQVCFYEYYVSFELKPRTQNRYR